MTKAAPSIIAPVIERNLCSTGLRKFERVYCLDRSDARNYMNWRGRTQTRESFVAPALSAVLDDIELRVRVEFNKLNACED